MRRTATDAAPDLPCQLRRDAGPAPDLGRHWRPGLRGRRETRRGLFPARPFRHRRKPVPDRPARTRPRRCRPSDAGRSGCLRPPSRHLCPGDRLRHRRDPPPPVPARGTAVQRPRRLLCRWQPADDLRSGGRGLGRSHRVVGHRALHQADRLAQPRRRPARDPAPRGWPPGRGEWRHPDRPGRPRQAQCPRHAPEPDAAIDRRRAARPGRPAGPAPELDPPPGPAGRQHRLRDAMGRRSGGPGAAAWPLDPRKRADPLPA